MAMIQTLCLLFYEFFKTGLFAVGGGLATLPFLYNISDRYPDWFSYGDLANMIAVSESTPGPMGVNIATYTGFQTEGVLGAIVSTLGLVLPSLIIIIIIAKFLQKFQENKLVKYSFYGLRPAVAGLIAVAALQVLKVSVITLNAYRESGRWTDFFDYRALIIFAAAFVLMRIKKLKKIHPLAYILAGAVVGVLIF